MAPVNIVISDRDLLRLYTEDDGPKRKGLPPVVVDRFFEVMADIAAAEDERDLRRVKSRRLEKVPSECERCFSMRLNDQFRLIFRFVIIDGQRGVEVIDVRDYH